MRKNVLTALLLLLVFSDSVPQVGAFPVADDDGYELVFSDEFDLPDGSQPDTAKWVRSARGPSAWNRWISDEESVVRVEDGCLVCRAVPNIDLMADTALMLTGAVETLGKFAFKYGKVEVRMRTNFLQGNFPAAWMKPVVGSIDGKYMYGEIDIVEMSGNKDESSHTVHTHQSHILKKREPTNFKRELKVRQWHVYGIEWTSDFVRWTVDGETVGVFMRSDDEEDIADGQWTFDRDFYIRLNQSVGTGKYLRMVPLTDKIYETYFDWIRVYQKKT